MSVNFTVDKNLIKMIGRKLYSTHPLIIVVRELLQNSVDACNSVKRENQIKITIDVNRGESVTVVCDDNGIGMNKDILINKFLCLGASGKRDNADSTGGFGIAKAALLSNDFWSVYTTCWYIDAAGLGGDLIKRKRRIGTRVKCRITEDWYHSTIVSALSMIYFSDVKIHLILRENGIDIINDKNAGFDEKMDLHASKILEGWQLNLVNPFSPYDSVYTNYNDNDHYRLNGLVQFSTSAYGREIITVTDINTDKIPTDNDYPLTMSRESLKPEISSEVNKVLQKISENPNQTKFNAARKNKVIKSNVNDGITLEKNIDVSEIPAIGRIKTINQLGESPTSDEKRLLRLYAALLALVVRNNDYFGVGLTDDSCRGMRMYCEGQQWYMINPDIVFTDTELHGWSMDGLIHAVYFLAIHEAAHYENHTHNESFASEMSRLNVSSIGILLDNMPKLRKIIRNMEILG